MGGRKRKRAKDKSPSVPEKRSRRIMPVRGVSMNVLPDDILVIIFELLPPADRCRTERVDQRWRDLAKFRSWSNFKVLKADDFPVTSNGEVVVGYPLDSVLPRCAKFLDEVDLRRFHNSIDAFEKNVRYMAKLRHLHLGNERVNLIRLVRFLPKLKSLALHGREIDSAGIKDIRTNCKELELLHLTGRLYSPGFNCRARLPSTLKCFEINNLDIYTVMDRINEQGIQLESLSVRGPPYLSYWPHRLLQMNTTCLSNFSVQLSQSDCHDFLRVLRSINSPTVSFQKLHSLNLKLLNGVTALQTEELISLTSQNCSSLEHVGIYCYGLQSDTVLTPLAALEHLKSISITFPYPSPQLCRTRRIKAVKLLVKRLITAGRLEHFETNMPVDDKYILRAITSLKNLHAFFCSNRTFPLEYLKEALDNERDDNAPIFRTNIDNADRALKCKIFNHPGLEYCEKAPISHVLLQYQYGGLRDRGCMPHFVTFPDYYSNDD
ncbi:F-box/LRR-repeat protein 2 [Ditylenchus destructor]|uniref:F-box/LRR-repeat protein 2 n=1 Tax=Ditylenchus destructor TaxID=166010 RepID=A0AAD4MJ58_9BILA|nr:F-box/LRR-repeat protein 2 [Ditylenchus destructor]